MLSGGTANNTVVNSAGSVQVSNGGVALNTTLNSGGNELVVSGGVASSTIINKGGTETVNYGGVDSGSTVYTGGTEVVNSGGVASGTIINKGGTETVNRGGVDDGSTVYTGGTEIVNSGGLAINTYNYGYAATGIAASAGSIQINNGGKELVNINGVYYVTVNNGGMEQIASGGIAYYTTINSGGSEQIASGGTDYSSTIHSGGSQVISKGGTANNSVVYSGGVETVASGGIDYLPVNSGGTENVLSGGKLVVNDGLTGIGLNGGAILDLQSVIATKGSVNTTNQLLLTNGSTVVETLGLVGDNSNFGFSFKTDGAGGTLVTTTVIPPALSTLTYNAAAGQLSLTGTHLTSLASNYNLTHFTLKGDGNTNYTLTSGSSITGTPSNTAATIQLSAADQVAINGLLNKNGVQANDGVTTYNLSATSGWDIGAGAVSTKAVTVSNVTAPSISGVTYNAATGVFSVTGANLDNHGSASGITLPDFTLTGGRGTYTFSAANDTVSNLTATGFSIKLSAADKTSVNSFVNNNGTGPLVGNAYNLSVGVNWDSDNGAKITTQGVTVSGVSSGGLVNPQAVTLEGAGNIYVTDNHVFYTPTPTSAAPTQINNLWENTGQIELSKALFTAFAGANVVTDANFSNAAAATTPTDYLYYNASNGGVYYDANGSTNGPAVEIAVAGLTTHPVGLTLGDFTLIA